MNSNGTKANEKPENHSGCRHIANFRDLQRGLAIEPHKLFAQ
jgi:hypothetical protein